MTNPPPPQNDLLRTDLLRNVHIPFDLLGPDGGAIKQKHDALGGDAGFLGPAASGILLDQTSGNGCHVDYRGAHIYWSHATGAHAIYGFIYDKWISQGGPKSGIAYPITDEASTADNKCRFNNFSRGAIYWTPSTGAHLVYGAIYKKWVAVGGESGYGFPVIDESPAGHGRYNDFSLGSIYWSNETQAHTVYGDIHIKYLSIGGPTSWLGLPKTDEMPIPGATGRMNKFEGGAIYWYGGFDTILVQRGLQGPSYNFSVDTIACNVTRSRSTDTLWISVSVAIAGRNPVVQTKALGDHAEGFTYPGVPLTNIPISDDEIAVFTYVIINNGHSTESDVHKLIESAATKIATTGANAAANAIGEGAKVAAGAAIGAALGSAIPILGTIVGAALGALSSFLLGELINSINPNCDGPIASAAMTIGGAELRKTLSTGQPWTHKDSNPGVDSAGGCGSNSDYSTTWSISRA